MSLLRCFLNLVAAWDAVFFQKRTHARISELVLRLLVSHRRRTVTAGLDPQRDWSGFYRAFSQSAWDSRALFQPVWANTKQQLATLPFIPVAIDDTCLWKSGKLRGLARWLRDALSPPFNINIRRGLRWLHAALLLPLGSGGAMALSVAFELACPPQKPKKGASKAELKAFRELQRREGLAGKAVAVAQHTRKLLDAYQLHDIFLLLVTDGGYTNKTLLKNLPERTHLIGRTRKDLAICRPVDSPGKRKVYGDPLPSPNQILSDDAFAWLSVNCFYGGQIRAIRIKEVANIRWPRGAGPRPLRLIIVAPTRYKPVGVKNPLRFHYNQPAYLLTTDLKTPVQLLLQAYFDRWQIEVLHRDQKTGLGLGQAQHWSEKAVKRFAPTMAAAFSLLKLAAIQAFGPDRAAADFGPLPRWRRHPPRRPSCNDLISRLRSDFEASSKTSAPFDPLAPLPTPPETPPPAPESPPPVHASPPAPSAPADKVA